MAKKQELPHSAPAATEPNSSPAAVAEEQVAQVPSIVTGTSTELQEKSMDEMFMEDAGSGLTNLGANDYAIPFITIVQKGSPQASRANAKYIKGAEAGAIMNTVTQDILNGENGIDFIPCGYSKEIVRWKPRDSGGGLVSHHKEGDPILKTLKRNERGQLFHEETGDLFIDTAYHFGLLLHEDGMPEWAVISMYSTQLKKSRTWNTTMRRIMKKGPHGVYNPPSYSHVYHLTTVGEAKDTYDWYGWRIVCDREVADVDLYKMAREFAKQIEAGEVRVSAPPQDFDGEAADPDSVPF
jgi:hypothetical protein